MSERKAVMNSNEIKEKETQEENVSMAPYVNEKLKYWLIAVVAILCIVTALFVVLTPETEEKNNSDAQTLVETTLNT